MRRVCVLGVCLLAACAASAAARGGVQLRRPSAVRVSSVAHGLRVRWRDASRGHAREVVRWTYRRGGRARSGVARLPGSARQYVLARAAAGVSYAFVVRSCTRRRCSAWSRPARGRLPARADGGSPAGGPATGTGGPAIGTGGTGPGSGSPSTAGSPTLGGCPVFPPDNAWNRDISQAPVDPHSDAYIRAIDAAGDEYLHADFGQDPTYGFPYEVVGPQQSAVPITYDEYGDESDPGPFPIPLDAAVEAGGDRHVLVLQSGTCRLYELYHARVSGGGWIAGSGATFDLRSNALRPTMWTSTDQAGLPILPGLVRPDEVAAGHIDHALRFTVAETQNGFIAPATHPGSNDDPNDPPMGLRLRLKASYSLAGFHGQALVVLQALKRYGMLVADTGTSWYISGATAPTFWDDEDLDQLKTVPGAAFEAVQTGPIHPGY